MSKPIYGTDFSKELSQIVEGLRHQIIQTRGQLSDIEFAYPLWKEQAGDVRGLLTCGLITLSHIKKKMAAWEIRRDDEAHGPSLPFAPRGVGMDVTPGCFVCHAVSTGYMANVSGFVDTRENGQKIVEWFGGFARLDYRDYEPNWIQVKVGGCEKHIPILEALCAATGVHGRIRKHTIDTCIAMVAE